MEKIIERIQKLLALAQSSNVHESATAAGQAAKLMAEHELDMADLQQHAAQKEAPEAIELNVAMASASKQVDRWRGLLADGIASGFGCHIWWHRYWAEINGTRAVVAQLRILGRKSNVQTCVYLYSYLEKEVARLAHEAWAAQVPRPLASAAVRWRNSFQMGAASEIAKRIKEMRAEVNRAASCDASRSTALVVVQQRQEEVTKAYADFSRKARLRSMGAASHKTDVDAYLRGRDAGAEVSLGVDNGRGLPTPQKAVR
jgi:hypothetical protein